MKWEWVVIVFVLSFIVTVIITRKKNDRLLRFAYSTNYDNSKDEFKIKTAILFVKIFMLFIIFKILFNIINA